jgi:type I restriction enzyme S subunit
VILDHVKRVVDFCRTGSGSTPSRNQMERYYEGGRIPWVKSGELREDLIISTEEHVTEAALKESSIKLVPAGAILIAMYGATVGRLAILGMEATTNQAVCHIVPDPELADIKYLYHSIAAQVPSIIAMGVGGAQPNISQAIIKELKIPLPPLPEQRRIAAILDQADALRAKRREALAQLDELTQSIFIEMFGDPARNPNCYPTRQLFELIETGDTINYGVVQPGDDVENGVPLIRVGDLIGGRVHNHSLKRIEPSIEKAYRRSRLIGDEILISCVGSVGVIALVTEAEIGFNIARAVARARLSAATSREFMAAQLNTESVQRYFTQELRTVSQPTLNIKQLAETRVICPPLDLQKSFELRIASLQSLLKSIQSSDHQLGMLFTSLQHRAFRGEL